MQVVMKNALKTIMLLTVILALSVGSYNARAQDLDRLHSLFGYAVSVHYSEGHQEAAVRAAELTSGAYRYLQSKLDFSPEVSLLVLSQDDWQEYASNVVYGMPHFTSGGTLVVAAEDNAFWRANMPPPELVDDLFTSTYTTPEGLSNRAFFELLPVHELGHAFFNQGGLKGQRIWLTEVYMNIMLHSYIDAERTDLLPALEQLPEKMASIPAELFPYTTLAQFEEHAYGMIGRENPVNYGWYQFRFHYAARQAYEGAGEDVLVKLWDLHKSQTAKRSDEELVAELEKIHPAVADVYRKWDNEQ